MKNKYRALVFLQVDLLPRNLSSGSSSRSSVLEASEDELIAQELIAAIGAQREIEAGSVNLELCACAASFLPSHLHKHTYTDKL